MHGEYQGRCQVEGGKLVVVELSEHAARYSEARLGGDFFLRPPEVSGTATYATDASTRRMP